MRWLFALLALASLALLFVLTAGGKPEQVDATARVESAGPVEPEAALLDDAVVALSRLATERVAVERTREGASAGLIPATERATLIVRVVDEQGLPRVGAFVEVELAPFENVPAGNLQILRPTGSPSTGEDGRMRIPVEAGQPWRITARTRDGNSRLAESLEGTALSPGEEREVDLVLAGATGVFHVRFLAREDDRPLAGVRVDLGRYASQGARPAAVVESDERGRVRIELGDLSGSLAIAEAEGRGPKAFVPNDSRSSNVQSELVIRLSAGAAIRGTVGGGAQLEGWTVIARVPGYALRDGRDTPWSSVDPSWSSAIGPAGEFEFSDLPPEVELTLDIRDGARLVAQAIAQLVLDPGETRELELRVGAAARLDVFARDENSGGVSLLRVGLFAAEQVTQLGAIPRHVKPKQELRTDEVGRGSFESVPGGSWVVAPLRSAEHENLVAIGVPVLLDDSSSLFQVELDCSTGLWISGHTRDPDGKPMGGVSVLASNASSNRMVMSEESGAFRIGPLIAGDYTVQTIGLGRSGWADPEPQQVSAGQTGVEFVALNSMGLQVHLVDNRGQPLSEAWLTWCGSEIRSWRGRTVSTTPFLVEGLQAGTYSLVATCEGVGVGYVSGVQVFEDRSNSPIEITVEPSAQVRVRVTGAFEQGDYCTLNLYRGNTCLVMDGHQLGTVSLHEFPPGPVRVVATNPYSEGSETREVTVQANLGSIVDAELDFGP